MYISQSVGREKNKKKVKIPRMRVKKWKKMCGCTAENLYFLKGFELHIAHTFKKNI